MNQTELPKKRKRKQFCKMTKVSHKPANVSTNPFLSESSDITQIPFTSDSINDSMDISSVSTNLENNVIGHCRNKSKSKSYSYMFYSIIPIHLLFDILEQVCVKRNEYYIFDLLAFRSMKYRNLYPEFANKIISHYRPHYQSFVTRQLSYSSFVTILRHICKMNNIKFDCKDNYCSPGYNIDYYVYHNKQMKMDDNY